MTKRNAVSPPVAICMPYKEFVLVQKAMAYALAIAELSFERGHCAKGDVELIAEADRIIIVTENKAELARLTKLIRKRKKS